MKIAPRSQPTVFTTSESAARRMPRMKASILVVEDEPVLITSAKRSDAERIAGLRAGADDYLAKPFNPHELTARVAAILRRTRPAASTWATPVGDEPILSLAGGRLLLDPASRRYTLAGADAGRLTPGEAALLLALARRPGVVL